MLRGKATAPRGRRARDLPGHRQRPRDERLDLHRAGHRLDRLGRGLGGGGGDRRAQGAAARRRARARCWTCSTPSGSRRRRRTGSSGSSLAGRRIMGMGHRIYRTRDPRAAVLERAVERLEQEGHRTPRLVLARAVEHAAEDVLRRSVTRTARSGPTWSSTPRCCSTRSGSRARRSARCSPAGGWRAGWPTSTSSGGRGGSSVPSRGTSVRGRSEREGRGRVLRASAQRPRSAPAAVCRHERPARANRTPGSARGIRAGYWHSSSSSGRAQSDSASARLRRKSSRRRSGSMLASARESAFRSHPHTPTTSTRPADQEKPASPTAATSCRRCAVKPEELPGPLRIDRSPRAAMRASARPGTSPHGARGKNVQPARWPFASLAECRPAPTACRCRLPGRARWPGSCSSGAATMRAVAPFTLLLRHRAARASRPTCRGVSSSTARSTSTSTPTSTRPRTTPTSSPARAPRPSAPTRLPLNLASIELVKDARAGRLPPLDRGRHRRERGALRRARRARPPVPDVWRYVQQASVSAKVPVGRGLVIEGGIYPSHIGMEGLASQGNWNYTRSWLGEYSPYYQTGIKFDVRVRRCLVGAAAAPQRLAAHRRQQQREVHRHPGRLEGRAEHLDLQHLHRPRAGRRQR